MDSISKTRTQITIARFCAIIAPALLAGGCYATEGNGELATETRQVATFSAIDSTNGVEVVLTVDPDHTGEVVLEVSGESNLLDLIETHVSGQTLHVSVAPVVAHLPLRVEATVAAIDGAEATDGSSVVVYGIESRELSVRAADGGHVTATGAADALTLRGANGFGVDLEELTTDRAQAELRNGGSARVCVTDQVSGSVTNGALLVVGCGGDASAVRRSGGGSVR